MKKILIEKQIHAVLWDAVIQRDAMLMFSLCVSLCSFSVCSYNYKLQRCIMRVSNDRFWSNKSPALEQSTHSHLWVTRKCYSLKKEKRRKTTTKKPLNTTLNGNALVKGMSYTLLKSLKPVILTSKRSTCWNASTLC